MSVTTRERTDLCGPGLTGRLLVATQDGDSRAWHGIGFLGEEPDGWSFHYIKSTVGESWFTPLFGFDDVTYAYRSSRLFPLFAQRLMSARRPDRPAYLEALALKPDARPFDVLARSGGRRAGDNIELLPVPSVGGDQQTCVYFLVHGVRHVPGAGDAIAGLLQGQELDLLDDPTNPVDGTALIVASGSSRPLGYVPAPLLDYVHSVRAAGGSSLIVEQANGPEVGSHLRLLVRLSGRYLADRAPFTGPDWLTV